LKNYLNLIGLAQSNEAPFDMGLRLKNVGMGAAFNINVEYSIKGVKNSRQTQITHIMERDTETDVALVQNGQPLRNNRLANRVINVKLKLCEQKQPD